MRNRNPKFKRGFWISVGRSGYARDNMGQRFSCSFAIVFMRLRMQQKSFSTVPKRDLELTGSSLSTLGSGHHCTGWKYVHLVRKSEYCTLHKINVSALIATSVMSDMRNRDENPQHHHKLTKFQWRHFYAI